MILKVFSNLHDSMIEWGGMGGKPQDTLQQLKAELHSFGVWKE